MERRFKPGTILKHFKREFLSEKELKQEPFSFMYKVIGEAIHTETREVLLIYQALYGSNAIFARPLEMATGLVDKTKYPDVKQEYRLEECNESDITNDNELLWNALKPHIGHTVHVESYVNNSDEIVDICLECEDCGEVILNSELYTLSARKDMED